MKKYLTTTFSPAMLGAGNNATVVPVHIDVVRRFAPRAESAVGHETTAAVLSALLGCEVKFSRVNLTLEAWDVVYCVIPAFRASEAREFTREEVEAAGFRCFQVCVY